MPGIFMIFIHYNNRIITRARCSFFSFLSVAFAWAWASISPFIRIRCLAFALPIDFEHKILMIVSTLVSAFEMLFLAHGAARTLGAVVSFSRETCARLKAVSHFWPK